MPLLERMKFVAIFTSNLDEFFMIRVGSLYDMVQTDEMCIRDRSRHCLVRGNELDTEKASVLLMDDFRNGRLGKLTLEYPDAY